MKKITLFYQPRCPFCKMAFRFFDELCSEHPEFKQLEIETIDELAHPDVADRYDYYYVPTYYVGEEKVHEGGIYKEELKALLLKALE